MSCRKNQQWTVMLQIPSLTCCCYSLKLEEPQSSQQRVFVLYICALATEGPSAREGGGALQCCHMPRALSLNRRVFLKLSVWIDAYSDCEGNFRGS